MSQLERFNMYDRAFHEALVYAIPHCTIDWCDYHMRHVLWGDSYPANLPTYNITHIHRYQ